MEILKCSNLKKQIKNKIIVENISFSINKGDIVGFIGPNGAGKTTIIKLILGLMKLSEGKVFINGFDIEKDFIKAIEKVGSIVENPDLYMYLSGYDNLKIIANNYKNISKDRIHEVIKIVGLENRIKDKVSTYSLGMRQRLGIAEAIINEPELLILDEPTNGLDPEGIKDLRDIIITLSKKEKMSILVSSHNLSELETFCTKICIIKNGEIIEESNMEEINKEKEKDYYIVEVEDTLAVKKVISNAEIIDNKHFKIFLEDGEISDFVIKLKTLGINICEIKKEKITLEETFLNKVGGNKID